MDNNYLRACKRTFPIEDYLSVRKKIICKCKISNSIWKNWLNGRTKIPPLAESIIKEEIKNKRSEVIENINLVQYSIFD
jgi:hypothetical protein